VKSEAVEPAFVVFESGDDVGPLEGFGVVRISALEAGLHESSFGLGEEGGCGGVVVDEQIGYDGDDDSQESFLEPCVSSSCS
jgi:hypothetical protein